MSVFSANIRKETKMKAFLILEDGSIYEGEGIGVNKDVICEVVFNTSMAGYPEILTDPSYAGQAVCMTYPLIGNYGVCRQDLEAVKAWPEALIVRNISDIPSNFRCDISLQDYLVEQNVTGITGIETRALTRKLRDHGTMNGMITTDESFKFSMERVLKNIRNYSPVGVVRKVSCMNPYTLYPDAETGIYGEKSDEDIFAGAFKRLEKSGKKQFKVALLDLGAKRNIVNSLLKRGCQVTVFPAYTPASAIIESNPDGIMLSNGPGDPKECVGIIKEIKKLYNTDIPIFAICLGHQLMALATGANTYKLKYGHRGANHPVKDLKTGRVYITSQNHGYAVDASSIDPNIAENAFENVNDKTNEGLRYLNKNIFTVQFHPESSPGPHDSAYLFDNFIKMMEEK